MKDNSGVREFLIDWITAYKDGAERNALAETPKESADYLLQALSREPQIDENGHDCRDLCVRCERVIRVKVAEEILNSMNKRDVGGMYPEWALSDKQHKDFLAQYTEGGE